MIKVIATPGATIALGRQGENLARCVEFNLSKFRSLYGDGSAQLLVRRPEETEPYPAYLEVDGDTAVWTLTSADTAISGHYGKAELQWYVGEVLAKSTTWNTVVQAALGEPREEAPEPYLTWMEEMLQVAADADISEAEAKKAMQGAVEAMTKAKKAQENAETARAATEDEAKAAENSAGAAAGYSQNAYNSASVAVNAAEMAESAANNAGISAGKAATFESGAKTQAEKAESAASASGSKAKEAATSAEAAAELGYNVHIQPLVEMELPVVFSIVSDGTTIHKLDNRCLDLEWIPAPVGEKVLVSARTVENGDLVQDLAYDDVLGVPTINVYFDEVRYECEVLDYGENIACAGNLTQIGGNGAEFPFILQIMSSGTRIVCASGEHIVSISANEYAPLPQHYLSPAFSISGNSDSEITAAAVAFKEGKRVYYNGYPVIYAADSDATLPVMAVGGVFGIGVHIGGKRYETILLDGGVGEGRYLRSKDLSIGMPVVEATDDIIIKSSTPDSTKRFKITVDDSGTLTATEVTE